MKKSSLLLALVGMIFFTSCEKENTPSSLAGTTWKAISYTYSSEKEIHFTATHAFYYADYYSEDGSHVEYFVGTYTYNAPDLVIEVTEGNRNRSGFTNFGSVKGHTLTLYIQETEDTFSFMDLQKQ